ncbi:MAG: helix-hairpin-helix domain-containing protein [Bacteroidota bacterium]
MPARPKWNWALYSRSQQLALWSLTLIIVLVFALSHLLRWSPREIPLDEDLLAAAAMLRSAPSEAEPPNPPDEENSEESPTRRSAAVPVAASFPFNPNTVSQEELQRLGLQEYQARAWVRYRASGAQFRQATDIGRLRVLKPADVDRLLPLVQLPAEEPHTEAIATNNSRAREQEDENASSTDLSSEAGGMIQESNSTTDPGSRVESFPTTYENRAALVAYTDDFTIDINQASAAEWEQLRGIGPYWAGRIIKFRDALGGFTALEQIGDTYGFPDSTFQAIRHQLEVGDLYRLLPINQATVDELKAHPYINSRLANVLVNYREQHGPYRSGDDLANIRILTEAGRARLIPYLAF